MTGRYVVGFAFDQHKRVAMIKKKRPEWQRGLFNGIGGKIELNETPFEAMAREFDEETGVEITNWTLFLTLRYPDSEIYFFKAQVPTGFLEAMRNETDEPIYSFPVNSLTQYSMVKNLSWILPLALYTEATYLPMEAFVTEHEPEGNDPG